MRWLWFNPAAIKVSLSYRGASLQWHTRETGTISMAQDGGVVFGVNQLGLVNVYAKDIAYMSLWQQKIWSGFNVAPDGGVSRELLASQAEGTPANSKAPEAFLLEGRDALNQAMLTATGVAAFRCDARANDIIAHATVSGRWIERGFWNWLKTSAELQQMTLTQSNYRQLCLLNLERKEDRSRAWNASSESSQPKDMQQRACLLCSQYMTLGLLMRISQAIRRIVIWKGWI